MQLLTKSQILDARDLTTEQVEVPEWGGAVLVRGLTGSERDAYEASFVDYDKSGNRKKPNLSNIRARLVAMAVVNEDGSRMFTDGEIVALARKSASALSRVFEVAQKLAGLSDEDVKDLEGNSDADPSDGSTSN